MFASAYDTDDTLYRLAVFVPMAGLLIVAAGISEAFVGWRFGIIAVGYVVMRLAMLALRLRAAASDRPRREAALRYAGAIAALPVCWVARLALPQGGGVAAFLVLGALELAVAVWAQAAGRTGWHPGHIAERYGLFTIIVLDEALLAATIGARAVHRDTLVLGRHGEPPGAARCRLRVERDGAPLLDETLDTGDLEDLRSAAVLGDARAVGALGRYGTAGPAPPDAFALDTLVRRLAPRARDLLPLERLPRTWADAALA